MITTPVTRIATSRRRNGIRDIARPARPAAASSPVARTAAGSDTSAAPAARSLETNGVHELVPRSTSVSELHSVVTRADSMKSRNGGDSRDSSNRGTSHHRHASARPRTHQAPKTSRRRSRARSRVTSPNTHHASATPAAAAVATAFTAPIRATAHADRNAACHSGRGSAAAPSRARTIGTSTQGASMYGSVSDEMEPRVLSTRGEVAKIAAASRREANEPTRSASARRTSPTTPTVSSRAHHRRCVTQPGSPARSPSAKKAPCGKK